MPQNYLRGQLEARKVYVFYLLTLLVLHAPVCRVRKQRRKARPRCSLVCAGRPAHGPPLMVPSTHRGACKLARCVPPHTDIADACLGPVSGLSPTCGMSDAATQVFAPLQPALSQVDQSGNNLMVLMYVFRGRSSLRALPQQPQHRL
jgi:hypothetical protein